MERGFYIHAGAHRTGTSSFQLCLEINQSALNRAGFDLAYPGRDGVEGGKLGLRLPSPRHGMDQTKRFSQKVKDTVDAFSRDPGRSLILSEENIPGRMLPFFGGRFYPAAEARAAALKGGLEGRLAGLLFIVRDYAGLYQSAWRKRSEDKLQKSFASNVENLVAMDRGWPELLQTLQKTLQPERFVVVEYRARGKSIDLLKRIVPDVAELQEPDRQINTSVTEAGLAAVQALYKREVELSAEEKAAIFAEHAEDRRPRNLTPYTDAAERSLKDRYARDLDRIAAMPGLEFVNAP